MTTHTKPVLREGPFTEKRCFLGDSHPNKGFRARSSGQDAGAATTFEQAYNSVTKGLGLWSMIMVKTHFASTLIEKSQEITFS